jgi:hypothetical protein
MSSLQQNWRKRRRRFCLEVKGVGIEGWGRNHPNNVCIYEYMNKEKKVRGPEFKLSTAKKLSYRHLISYLDNIIFLIHCVQK